MNIDRITRNHETVNRIYSTQTEVNLLLLHTVCFYTHFFLTERNIKALRFRHPAVVVSVWITKIEKFRKTEATVR